MGLLVKMPAFDGQSVLGPEALDVDQGALPLAEEQVLEGGDRQEVVFSEASIRSAGIHGLTSGGSFSRIAS